MPYSRIPVDNLHKTIETYITDDQYSQLNAAIDMGCESLLTFRFYYSKVIDSLSKWILTLIELIGQMGKGMKPPNLIAAAESCKNPILANWKKYDALISKYMEVKSGLPGGEIITEACYYGYIYPLLGGINMKLGP